jgi:hypothetical protein
MTSTSRSADHLPHLAALRLVLFHESSKAPAVYDVMVIDDCPQRLVSYCDE